MLNIMSKARLSALLWIAALALTIEAISVPVMFATMGHAGPEGRFAFFGWIATLINLPGMFLTGFILGHSPVPELVRFALMFVLQVLLLGFILLVVWRWLNR